MLQFQKLIFITTPVHKVPVLTVWLKSFNFKSFCALKIILFLDSASTQLAA